MNNNRKKILHLSLDDKFTDMAIYYFEQLAPDENDLVVYSRLSSLQYIRTHSKIVTIEQDILDINLNNYNLIVIHSLVDIWYKLIINSPTNIPIVWIGWGFDYYDMLNEELLLPQTKDFNNTHNFLVSCKSFLKKKLAYLRMKNIPKKRDVIKKINYFAPVLESEYEAVSHKLNVRDTLKYVDFNYGSLEKNYIRNYTNKQVCGNNILIGNSATATNNHLEIFQLLKKFDISGRVIICPLSYGDEIYKNKILKCGTESFKEQFQPLVDFMPIDDYITKILSCRYVIMNHVRQQALGNIITMLYLGAKVFLREENPVYSFLKQINAVVYSVQDLEQQGSLTMFTPLSQNDVLQNQSVLKSFIGEEIVLKKTQNLISLRNLNEC